jgi:anti-anti-sigma regulatory factor
MIIVHRLTSKTGKKNNKWMAENFTYKVGERIDSFSFTEFKSSIEAYLEKGPSTLTLDLTGTKFLSIPCIKLIAFCASELQEKAGRLILLGPTEKLKRQIGIYGSLAKVTIKKSERAPEEQPSVGLPVHDEIPGF